MPQTAIDARADPRRVPRRVRRVRRARRAARRASAPSSRCPTGGSTPATRWSRRWPAPCSTRGSPSTTSRGASTTGGSGSARSACSSRSRCRGPPRRSPELEPSLGDGAAFLPAVYAGLGLPEPEPDRPSRGSTRPSWSASFVRLWSLVDPTGEAHARVARLRRRRDATDRRGLARRLGRDRPAGRDDPGRADRRQPRPVPTIRPIREQNPSIGDVRGRPSARRARPRAPGRGDADRADHRRDGGRARRRGPLARPERQRPPAIAFVDLAGFTSLTEERGDEAAATAAATPVRPRRRGGRGVGGRVVKQLGDGVLLRFPDSETAIRAVTGIVGGMDDAGLPPAHAGIAAGPVVVRDGDVFGRTVNLASRISAEATAGEVLVEEGVVVALPRGTATLRTGRAGRAEGLPRADRAVAATRERSSAEPTASQPTCRSGRSRRVPRGRQFGRPLVGRSVRLRPGPGRPPRAGSAHDRYRACRARRLGRRRPPDAAAIRAAPLPVDRPHRRSRRPAASARSPFAATRWASAVALEVAEAGVHGLVDGARRAPPVAPDRSLAGDHLGMQPTIRDLDVAIAGSPRPLASPVAAIERAVERQRCGRPSS